MASDKTTLSRRERQIMDIIYHRGRATAAEVLKDIPDPPSYSSIRALLRLLEEKGHVTHEADGQRYVFIPTVPREQAGNSAIKHMLRTFFNGSREQAVAAMLDLPDSELSDSDLEGLSKLIDKARKEGR